MSARHVLTRLRCATACGLLPGAILLTAGPAWAQLQVPPPAVIKSVDRNGVDVVNLTFTVNLGSVSVGPAQGGLAALLSTTEGRDETPTVPNYPRLNLVGGINEWHEIHPFVIRRFVVTVMGQATVFTRTTAGTFIFKEGEGGTLVAITGGYVYTAVDGTVATFSTSLYSYATEDTVANLAGLSTVRRPNGELITYHYTGSTPTARKLQSVTNNYGYQIHLQYDGSVLSKIEAINNAVDRCSPTANVCPTFSTVWPTLSYDGDWTNNLGQARRGSPTGTIWATAPAVTWQSVSGGSSTSTAGVRTVSDGAGTWTYAYGEPVSPYPDEVTTNTVTDPLGHVTTVEVQWYEDRNYDNPVKKPKLKSVTDGEGNTTEYGIDGRGRLTSLTNPEGDSQAWTYNGLGALTLWTRTPKTGTATTISAIYPTSCTNPSLCGRPVSVTDQRGNKTDFAYDVAGNLLSVTEPPPTTGAVQPQTRYTWIQKNAWYKQSGATTITQSSNPIWVQTEVSQCATGAAPCNGAATEVQTITAYQAGSASAASNILPVSVASGAGNGSLTATTATTYDAVRNVLTVDGPLSGVADTTRYVYDVVRQSVGIIGPDPDGSGARLFPATKTLYNANGQPTSVQRGTTAGQSDAQWAAFAALTTDTATYDARAKKIRDLAASGTTAAMLTQYTYDTAGNLTCSTQRMNPATFASPPASACTLATEGTFGKDRITRNTYDDADRLLTTTSGYLVDPIVESQTWTPNGKVLTRTDGRGNVSTYVYDAFDRVSRLRFPNASGGGSSTTDYENYTYDASDNVTAFRNRAGQTIASTFDSLNRKTLLDAPTGTADVTYAYDNLDRMLSATSGTVSVTRTWDALSRMTAETGRLGLYGFQYDLAGRRTRITWPDAFYAQYTWDLSDSVTLIGQNGATSGVGVLAAYTYDNLARRIGTTRGNGVSSTSAWDAADRLTSLSHNLAGSTQDVTLGFTYNPAAQIVSRSSSNAAYTYVAATGTTAYVNNGKNQMTSVGGVAATYDANGNILSDGQDHFTYDALNRLTHTDGRHYAYDPLGRLTAMGTRELSVVDGRPAAVHTSDGTVINRFVPGPATSETVGYSDGAGAGTPYWLLSDERASAIAYAAADGTAAIKTYDEYGVPRTSDGGYIRFAGLFTYNTAEGLYYAQARFYAPRHGRFLQPDPILYDAGLNLYAYVGGDPVNRVDPTGTDIVVTSDKEGFLSLINSLSGLDYETDLNGRLFVLSGSTGNAYDARISELISSSATVTLSMGETFVDPSDNKTKPISLAGGAVTSETRAGGANITISRESVRSATDDNNNIIVGYGRDDALLHELVGHASPIVTGRFKGDAVFNENVVRRSLGLPVRNYRDAHVGAY